MKLNLCQQGNTSIKPLRINSQQGTRVSKYLIDCKDEILVYH